MPDILWYVIKVSISLAAMYLFYKCFLARLTFYQWNRWYLLGYTLVCFFLPLMNIYGWMEVHNSGQVLRFVPAMHSLKNNLGTLPESQWTLYGVVLLVFGVGVLVMLARICIQFYSLHKMHKRARLLTNEGIRLYEVNHPIIPFSFGMSVFIHPAQHDESELKDIIRHEMVHVREHHTVDIIFTEILVALNWFNPFAWLLRQSIRQNLEFIADRQVLEHGLDRKQYQHLLLKVIGQQQFSIASHLNFSALKKRITMMNKIKSARVHLIKFVFAIPIIAILLLAFRQDQGPQQTMQELVPTVTATDTLPPPARSGSDKKVNTKGYIITVADNEGECIVIVKNEQKKLVKAVPLTDWNKDKSFEKTYGKVPPPPPPPPPPLAPLPPKATKMAANIQEISVVNQSITVTLKNGKTEYYNLKDKKEKAAFEQKYGTGIREVAAPAVAPEAIEVPVPVPAVQPVAVFEDETITLKASNITIHENADGTAVNAEVQPIYYIDGKESTKKEINAIPPNEIAEIQVFKGKTAIDKYGQKGKNGVILILLKKSNISILENADGTVVSPEIEPIYYIDGKEATKKEFNAVAPDEIAEVQVFKGKTAIEKYGQKGKNGVILILLKNPKKVSLFNPIAILSVKKDKC